MDPDSVLINTVNGEIANMSSKSDDPDKLQQRKEDPEEAKQLWDRRSALKSLDSSKAGDLEPNLKCRSKNSQVKKI